MISLLVAATLILVSGCSHSSGIVAQTSNSTHNAMFPFTLNPTAASSWLSSVANVSIVGQRILQRELKACGWRKFVLVTPYGLSKNFLEYIRRLFTSGPLSSTLTYEVTLKTMEASLIAEAIWNAYNKQRIFNFIWITREHQEVIQAAHNLFDQKSCGYGALMTSRINFILVTFTTDILKIALNMESSLFDNVALFTFNENPPALEKAYTHMWRMNRRREFQEIADLDKKSSDSNIDICKIFPNIKHRFNGRHLYGLAKEWLPEFYKAHNEGTGEREYSGFYIDVFDTLATTLNFTYTLVPSPDTDDNLTWTAYSQMVSSCQVDFGINLFTNNAIFHYNVSTSFPVLYSNYIGAYINRSKPAPYKIFLVLKVEIYLVVGGCLLVTVLLYLLLTYSSRLPGESLFLSGNHTNDQKPLNQIHCVHIQRSSVFEVDWQAKYKYLEIPESSSSYKQIIVPRNRQKCYKNNTHYKRKPVQRRINRAKKISFGQVSIKFKKIKSINHYFAKLYRSKIMKNKVNKNTTIGSQKQILTAQESKKCRNDSIYNNSSHYVTEYVSKDCFVSFEYAACQHVVPVQPFKSENTSRKVDQHSLKTPYAELLEMLSSRQQHVFDVFFGFLGTLANQGSLPDAVHWAPRVLLAAWSFMMIVLVATYNGNLTANFVDTTQEVPIKSFDDLVSKGDYRWGTWNETLMYSLLEASGPGTTLRKLYEGIDRFSKTDPSVLGSLNDLIAHIKSGKFVALISSFTFEYLEDYTDLPGLTVIPDILLTANGAFVFPNNSELNLAISRQLIAMRDSGVTNHIFQRLKIGINTTMKVNEDSSNVYLTMENVAGLFFISGYGVIIAVAALVVEILIPKFRSKMIR